MSKGRGYFSHVDAGRPVLAGHKRVRKKLIAPLSDLPRTKHISFTHDIYPELLWIGLLFDEFGFRGGIEVAAPFQQALSDFDPRKPWYRLSSISGLSAEQWESLPEKEGSFKAELQRALAPCAKLYSRLPLQFVNPDIDPSVALTRMKVTVERHSNRFEMPGAALIGAYVFLLAFTGKMSLPRDVIAGLNEIVGNPGSDAAELASSTARATMMASWLMDGEYESDWPSAFWRSNWEISTCDTGQSNE